MAKKYRYGPVAPCKQAVIFARVSTKEQEPGASLKAQKEAMEDYCNKRDFLLLRNTRLLKALPMVNEYNLMKC